MVTPWQVLFMRPQEADPGPELMALTGHLVGVMHGLVWRPIQGMEGTLRPEERALLNERLRISIERLYPSDEPTHRRLAILVDWWLQAVAGEGPLGQAYVVGDALEWLGEPLRRLLDQDGGRPPLVEAHGPRLHREARAAFENFLNRPQGFHKKIANDIFNDMRHDARELLRDLDAGKKPNAESPLLVGDMDEWAGQSRGTEQLIQGVRVWNALAKSLHQCQDLARRAADTWTARTSSAGTPLPERWSERLSELFGTEGAAAAEAVLYDVARLSDPDIAVPELLASKGLIDALKTLPESMDLHARVGLLPLVRAARSADPRLAPPAWVEEARALLEKSRAEVRALSERARLRSGAEDTSLMLDLGLQSLQRFEARDAEAWITEARAALMGAEDDAELHRLEEETATWSADLMEAALAIDADADSNGAAAIVGADGDALSALRARHAALQAQWNNAFQSVERNATGLIREFERIPGSVIPAHAQDLVSQAKRALAGRRVASVMAAVEELRPALAHLQADEDGWLTEELQKVQERLEKSGYRGMDEAGVDAVIRRIRARAAADLPYRSLVDGLKRLHTVISAGQISELASVWRVSKERPALDGTWTLEPVAWAETGLPLKLRRLIPAGVALYKGVASRFHSGRLVVLPPGALTDLARPEGARVIKEPEPLCDHGFAVVCVGGSIAELNEKQSWLDARNQAPGCPVFAEVPSGVMGPYRLRPDDDRTEPLDGRGFVANMERGPFAELFGQIDCGRSESMLVAMPPTLTDMLEEGAEPRDGEDAASVERWLAGLCADADDVSLPALSKLVARLAQAELPEAIRENRLRRLRTALETGTALEAERKRAAERFLATTRGEREVAAAARRKVEQEGHRIEAEVAALRAEREIVLKELDGQIAERRAEVAEHQQRLDAALGGKREEAEALDAKVKALRAIADDAEKQLLLSLMAQAGGGLSHRVGGLGAGNEGDESDSNDAPIERRPVHAQPPGPIVDVAQALAGRLPHVHSDELSNLLATVISSRWTLLAGPPGGGKSTMARRFLDALGHGGASRRSIELVVRRDWQDDTALFGFWHPERRTWEPGSEGLLELLLRANHDATEGGGGLYSVLFEELNLAPPEHYLSRLISALEAHDPAINLYGADLAPRNALRYPAKVPVADNLRLIGTVNFDETVERLSPRFLSRASVIWLEPDVEAILDAAQRLGAAETGPPLHWQQLANQNADVALGASRLGRIADLVRHLHGARMPGAPSPRTLHGIQRYLAVSAPLLDAEVAQDFQVLQRVLPGLRGVGSAFGDQLGALADRLERFNWPRSAERCARMKDRGHELGDFYDYFHG